MFTTQCHYCGKTYEAKRSTSKYCSGRCRLRAHRVMKTNADREIGVAYDALVYLNSLSDQDIDSLVVDMEKMLAAARALVARVDNVTVDCYAKG